MSARPITNAEREWANQAVHAPQTSGSYAQRQVARGFLRGVRVGYDG